MPNLRAALIAMGLAGVLSAASAGLAQAQSCVAVDGASTLCRLVLSQPRVFTVRSEFRPLDRGQSGARIAVVVNGRPCAVRYGLFTHDRAQCRVELPAGHTVIEATGSGPGQVRVELAPDSRLASLPREVKDLNPLHRFRDVFTDVLPFHALD